MSSARARFAPARHPSWASSTVVTKLNGDPARPCRRNPQSATSVAAHQGRVPVQPRSSSLVGALQKLEERTSGIAAAAYHFVRQHELAQLGIPASLSGTYGLVLESAGLRVSVGVEGGNR